MSSMGSGIPEMKSILSGVHLKGFLTIRTLIAKFFGLIFAFAGSLTIGKEGPFVHISSIICNQLLQLPYIFKNLQHQPALKQQLLVAACAMGVTSAFGAPFSGVVFSLEVMSIYYLVANLWKAAFCSITGVFTLHALKLISSVGLADLFSSSPSLVIHHFDVQETPIFIALGIVGGLLGAFFNFVVSFLLAFSQKKWFRNRWARWLKTLAVGVSLALISFHFKHIQPAQQHALINDLVLENATLEKWSELALLFVGFFCFTTVSVGLTSLPVGLYTPLFLTGTLGGRLVAEGVAKVFGDTFGIGVNSYALLGGAALASGSTLTISTAMVVVEMTGSSEIVFPALVTVLIACGVGRFFSIGIFDVLLTQKRLPRTLNLDGNCNDAQRPVESIMKETNLPILSVGDCKVADVIEILQKHPMYDYFPVVANQSDRLFLGHTKRSALVAMLERLGLDMDHEKHLHGVLKFEHDFKEQWKHKKQFVVSKLARHEGGSRSNVGPEDSFGGDVMTLDTLVDDGDGVEAVSSVDGIDVAFLFPGDTRTDADARVHVNPSAISVTVGTPLQQVRVIFSMLRLSTVWVLFRGKLVGVIKRKYLLDTDERINRLVQLAPHHGLQFSVATNKDAADQDLNSKEKDSSRSAKRQSTFLRRGSSSTINGNSMWWQFEGWSLND
eukprot:TRINITY_DN5620_c1_g5_i1.p1 TRINITY_DN5620_c1_g5~~TRINITY_DN5620_c1_g5_i1.p1  ORF type:complete len:680 (-),score=99.59 TRINITY_DN5620_c1_g5_i1:525-2531(-)